jgi:hypothetical protein
MNAIEAGYYELFEIAGGTHSSSTWGKVYNRQDANAVSYDIYNYLEGLSNPPDTTPPTIPNNLLSSNIEKHSFEVSWDASTDAENSVDYYNIYLDDILIGDTTLLNFNFGYRLAPNTEYKVEISAVDTLGNESNLSTALFVTTLEDLASVNMGGFSKETLL